MAEVIELTARYRAYVLTLTRDVSAPSGSASPTLSVVRPATLPPTSPTWPAGGLPESIHHASSNNHRLLLAFGAVGTMVTLKGGQITSLDVVTIRTAQDQLTPVRAASSCCVGRRWPWLAR